MQLNFAMERKESERLMSRKSLSVGRIVKKVKLLFKKFVPS